MRPSIVVSAILLAGATACSAHPDGSRPTTPPVLVRQSSPLLADTLWMRGGSAGDQPLVYPEYLAHDDSAVYIADQATHRVVALDQRTGATRWSTDSAASDLRSPGALSGLPGGGVVAIDRHAHALVILTRAGGVRRVVPLTHAEDARQVCALSDSTFLVAANRTRLPLVLLDAAGTARQRFELPWPELRGLSPIQTQLMLTRMGSRPQCVAALAYGHGMAAVGTEGPVWTTPYVERRELPAMRTTQTSEDGVQRTEEHILTRRPAVLDVTADDSTIAVLFEGDGSQRGRLIDHYAVGDGRYRSTQVAGRRVVGVQQHEGRLILLTGQQGYPAVVALRPRARRAASPEAGR